MRVSREMRGKSIALAGDCPLQTPSMGLRKRRFGLAKRPSLELLRLFPTGPNANRPCWPSGPAEAGPFQKNQLQSPHPRYCPVSLKAAGLVTPEAVAVIVTPPAVAGSV